MKKYSSNYLVGYPTTYQSGIHLVFVKSESEARRFLSLLGLDTISLYVRSDEGICGDSYLAYFGKSVYAYYYGKYAAKFELKDIEQWKFLVKEYDMSVFLFTNYTWDEFPRGVQDFLTVSIYKGGQSPTVNLMKNKCGPTGSFRLV